jgi:ankyrin repeat protein
VELLIKNEADVQAASDDGSTALDIATQNGNESIAKLLIDSGASILAVNGDVYLLNASQKGHGLVVKLLLENGLDVRATSDNKSTALHMAALNGHEPVCQDAGH